MPLRPETWRSPLSRLISRRMNPIYSPLHPLPFSHPPLPLLTVLPVFCPIVLSCLLINSPISTLVPAVTLSADCTPAQTNNKLCTEKLHKQKKKNTSEQATHPVFTLRRHGSHCQLALPQFIRRYEIRIFGIHSYSIFRNTIQLHLSHDSASENKVCMLWIKLLFVLTMTPCVGDIVLKDRGWSKQVLEAESGHP